MTSECVNKKQVIIIGNGPSAITLSYILAGNWPYYNLDHPHPDDQLHFRLTHPPPSPDDSSGKAPSATSASTAATKSSSRRVKSQLKRTSKSQATKYNYDSISLADESKDELSDEVFADEEENQDEKDDENSTNILPSILNYDLQYLCNGLEGRSINPVSVLLDTLQFPNADFGINKDTSLKWKYDSSKTIDHLVIGQGNPGGSWNSMIKCDETFTVSFSQWMQLPNLPINSTKYGQKILLPIDDDDQCCPSSTTTTTTTATSTTTTSTSTSSSSSSTTSNSDSDSSIESSTKLVEKANESINSSTNGQRISLANVAKYFKYYVATQQLSKYFVNNAIVTSVKFNEKNQLWQVSGWQKNYGLFNYWSENIVLATGNNDLPNRLKVRGEGYPFVLHSIVEMEKILTDAKNCNLHDSVLIVGSGLSAADAIITCRQHKIPVKHVFRRHPDDPALIFNQLPENMYPEYHAVHEAMKRSFYSGNSSSNHNHNSVNCGYTSGTSEYTPFPMHSVAEIRKNKEVILTNLLKPDDCSTLPCRTTVKVSYVLALIGRRPELSFIKPKELRSQLPMFPGEAINSRSNPLRIHPYTHECISQSNLYAMGPLVGDNFVRFVQGAALAIARDIITKSSLTKSTSSKLPLALGSSDKQQVKDQDQPSNFHPSDAEAICVI